MERARRKSWVLAGLIICLSWGLGSAEALGLRGSIKFEADSPHLIGLVYAVNPGGEKLMIDYQIPPLTRDNTTFWAPFALIVDLPGQGTSSKAHIRLDTRICITNTSEESITLKATFYSAEGQLLLQTEFVLGPHETLFDSVLRIVKREEGFESDFTADFDTELFD